GLFIFFFFFFQAEDGIRDRTVTGVQTCALPIWMASMALYPSPTSATHSMSGWASRTARKPDRNIAWSSAITIRKVTIHLPGESRSEERRVGKECRSGRGGGE